MNKTQLIGSRTSYK